MNESTVVWRRRVASVAALVNLAYVLITVVRLADAIGLTAGSVSSTPSGLERMLMFYVVSGIVILLVIGVAIASPLLMWLAVLAVGLWRGRRWARTGGVITFALVVVAFGVLVARSGADVRGYALAVMLASPAAVGLVVLIRGASAFAVPAPGAAAPPVGSTSE